MRLFRRTRLDNFDFNGNYSKWNQKNGRKLELKHLFFGFMGGFYFSEHFKPWMKYLWIFTNAMLVLLDLGGCIVYLTAVENKKLGDVFFAFFMINTVIIVTIFLPLLTYYFRNEYKLVLELNEHEIANQKSNVWRSKNLLIFLSANQFVVGQSYALIHLFFLFFIDERKYLYDVQYYVQPNPWVGKIHSRSEYFHVWMLQLAFTEMFSLVLTSFTSIFMTTAHEFYLAFTILCSRMETFSKWAENRFSELSQKDRQTYEEDRVHKNADYSKDVVILRRILSDHMVAAVKDFQELTRKSQVMKQFVEFAYGMFLTLGFLNNFFFIYILSSQKLEIFQKIKAVSMFAFAEAILFGLCITGKSFDDMGEMIRNQVQDIPWYYLNSSQNKIFYIFLYLTQKPIRFFGLKMFPMGMNTFLQSLKITYTFYSVLTAALGR